MAVDTIIFNKSTRFSNREARFFYVLGRIYGK